MHVCIFFHFICEPEKQLARSCSFHFTNFLSLFCNINFVNLLIDLKEESFLVYVGVIFRQLQRKVNFLSNGVMEIKTYNIFFGRVKLKNKILMLSWSKFLMMSDTCLKFDVCIFCRCNKSKMNKFCFFGVYLSDNDNKLFGGHFSLFYINIPINRIKLGILLVILRVFIGLKNIESKLIERSNHIESKVLFLD